MHTSDYFYKTNPHSASETAKTLWFYVHTVGWFNCDPEYSVTRKRDSFYGYQLKYVVRGKGYVITQDQEYQVGVGDIFALDLNHEHQYYADQDDPWEVVWVHFDGRQAKAFFQMLQTANCPVYTVLHPMQIEQSFRELFHMFEHNTIGLEARASSHINHILTEMLVARMEQGVHQSSQADEQYPHPIQDAIHFMQTHYNTPIKLEDIAGQALISPFYLSRLFKQTTGYSVMEYLLKIRLTQSKRLLIDTRLPIGEIAAKVGFSNQSYFGKLFKEYEHLTPKEYRLYQSEILSSSNKTK